MYSHSTKIRVRYGETDQMGYMYYGNYAQYYEVGRVEMLRSLGMSYSSMEADGIMMPVLELKCKYIKPGPLRSGNYSKNHYKNFTWHQDLF